MGSKGLINKLNLYDEPIQTHMMLMDVMTTANGLEITEEMILNSLDSFINKPVVLNLNQECKDYNDKEMVNNFNKEKTIGVIIEAEYNRGLKQVAGNVIWYDVQHIKYKYDNWQIEVSDDGMSFCLNCVEVF